MIRKPAVAGTFYPFEKTKLQSLINKLLLVETPQIKVKAGVVPHAGYAYSGLAAAYFYKTIKGQNYENIIILGPNHTGYGEPISIYPEGKFVTPTGDVKINDELASKIYGEKDETAHIQEHSVELQIPFLQTVLKDFQIVPIVIGDQSKSEMTKLTNSLKKNLTENDLLLASSDLSHYVSQEIAKKNDMKLINSILKFDLDTFYKNVREDQSACGFGPIAVAMEYANGSKTKLLKYDTSATASGDTSKVVGYSSIIFY